MELKYLVENKDYKNINEILSLHFKISTRLKNKLIKEKRIFLNGKNTDSRYEVNIGDNIVIDFNYEEDNSNIVAKNIPLDIIYEDEWFLVLNKPAGIAIHPSILHYEDSLSSGVKYYFDQIGLKKKIRPVNRLDFNTSGVVIFAKCEYIQECFSKQMQEGLFKKNYICLAERIFDKKIGTIDLPIARKPGSIIERCIDSNGQTSVTCYNVLEENVSEGISLVNCSLETGRTHQIRVHMKAIGHPLIGDTLYGFSSNLINRQALHSFQISCIHPVTKKNCNFKAEIPEDIKNIIKALSK